MSDKKSLVTRVAQAIAATPASADVLIGFDGFIDEIIRLVDTRQSVDAFTPIGTITQFGERVCAAAGKSCNIEMVQQQIKLGGNGPIMANNLVEQGYGVNYCGALGAHGVIHPVFEDFAARCKSLITLCDPGYSEALEFDDGKVIMGKMTSLAEVNWDSVTAQLPEEELAALVEKMELIGCVNWTMLPNMNSILKGLGALLAKRSQRAKLFIDLTDPRKRSQADIQEVLMILKDLQAGVDVILGLNEDESIQVATVLFGTAGDDLSARAQKIRTELGLFQVVVHPTRSAAVATAEGEWYVEGPYTPKPKLTTGAGDNFNAGYCNGL
ncbi:MAG: carbohydrate kinase family protein, partial [Kiritimatiellia bacterium]